MLMLRKMPLTFGSAIKTVLIFAVAIMELCTMVHPAPDSSGEWVLALNFEKEGYHLFS